MKDDKRDLTRIRICESTDSLAIDRDDNIVGIKLSRSYWDILGYLGHIMGCAVYLLGCLFVFIVFRVTFCTVPKIIPEVVLLVMIITPVFVPWVGKEIGLDRLMNRHRDQ